MNTETPNPERSSARAAVLAQAFSQAGYGAKGEDAPPLLRALVRLASLPPNFMRGDFPTKSEYNIERNKVHRHWRLVANQLMIAAIAGVEDHHVVDAVNASAYPLRVLHDALGEPASIEFDADHSPDARGLYRWAVYTALQRATAAARGEQ